MTSDIAESSDATRPQERPQQRQPGGWYRFGLVDLLILTVAVGVWVGVYANRQRYVALEQQLKILRREAGFLTVDDNSRINARQVPRVRYEESAWRFYLPPGYSYRLAAATREIGPKNLPAASHIAPLKPGRHFLLLTHHAADDKSQNFTVTADGRSAFVIQETPDWNTTGSFSSTGVTKEQMAFDVGQPVILRRTRVHLPGKTKNASLSPKHKAVNGLLLWIVGTPEAEDSVGEPPARK